MAKKILLSLILGMFLISLVSAYEPHKLDTNLSFSFTSNNATTCNVSTINTPYGVVTIDQDSTKFGQTFNNTIDAGNFSEIGIYCFNLQCVDGIGNVETGSLCRDITYLGKQLSGAKILWKN